MASVSGKPGHWGSARDGRVALVGAARARKLLGRPTWTRPPHRPTSASCASSCRFSTKRRRSRPARRTAHARPARLTIFVDNGSTDDGPAQIERAGAVLLREPRRGYGYPCLTGARAALERGAEAVVFMEADGTDDPVQVRLLAAPVLCGRTDLVIGSRRAAVRGRQGEMPLHQRLGNDSLALTLRILFGLRLSDDGPFRAVSAALLERLALEDRAYAFPTEMAVKARLARRTHRGGRHALPPARRPVEDRRHLARLAAGRARHHVVSVPAAALGLCYRRRTAPACPRLVALVRRRRDFVTRLEPSMTSSLPLRQA